VSWLDAGWQVFPAEPAVAAWVAAVRGPALAAAARGPLRHGGTWFVGVDALDNDAEGRVAGGPPLAGAALDAAVAATGVLRLHRAQVSVVHPGYPGRAPVETEAAHRFRRDRDAAHLDGLLPEGPERRRHLREPHAWILGVALTEADADASPLVVWEGSHRVIRAAFAAAFAGQPAERWGDIDVTGIYQRARAEVFGTCRRIALPLNPGETVLLHRLTIHGVAPWGQGAVAAPEGRAIAYLRPCFEDPADWLEKP
jgi:hypothetical protein